MQTNPLYIQTGAWSLGYCLKLAAGKLTKDTYRQGNVAPYVNTLWTAGTLGFVPPGGLPFVPPPPIPLAQQFLGVSQIGNDYTILDYVAALPGGGAIGLPPNNAFFLHPAGNQQGTNNADGAVPWPLLSSAFQQLLANAVAPPFVPFFAVVDSNGAHNVSATLARRAFTNTAGGRTKIIFNFDNHTDYGVNVVNNITCRGWGIFTVNPIGPAAAFADAYVNFGQGLNFSSSKYKIAGGGAVQTLAGIGVVAQIATLLGPAPNLNTVLGNVDFYVSIDRDFMQGSYTTYGDGKYTPATGRQAVADLLAAMHPATLVGFDVVGLPDFSGRSVAFPDYSNAFSGPLAQAVDDIAYFRNQVLVY